jgi:hypothetical protein
MVVQAWLLSSELNVRHNVPQEDPQAFAQAVVDVAGF